MHLAVFDIDGTLADSAEFDGLLYAEAIWKVLGIEIDCAWSNYSSVTDSGILDQIIDESSLSGERGRIHSQVRTEFVNLTKNYLDKNTEALREIPGAKALVDTLKKHPSVVVAIATGGWRETAEIKLRGIGIDPGDIPLATASDLSDRRDIIGLAESRAMNGRIALHRTYFGDGIWDKKAAMELNYGFVAVGDGVVHDISVPDLSDHSRILRYLGL